VQSVKRFGSVIGLKPEFEERYIILHRHTFPGVLKRIHDSNIRNYSIFLREGMLFSYYEYHGQYYEGDMQKISEDTITRDWWKLTDPMQEPIQDRKEGEWWASMDEIGHFSSTEFDSAHTQRLAYRTQKDPLSMKELDIPKNVMDEGHFSKLSIFLKRGRLYLYCECKETSASADNENTIENILSRELFKNHIIHWESMQEVFHTD
jgi:L-rhamnose mutarotase